MPLNFMLCSFFRSGTKINFGRHFGHHHQELLPPQYDRGSCFLKMCIKNNSFFHDSLKIRTVKCQKIKKKHWKKYYLIFFSAPAGNFSLAAGISAVMSQLQLSCVEEEQFRALNLDITCPSHVPHLETCSCILRVTIVDRLNPK